MYIYIYIDGVQQMDSVLTKSPSRARPSSMRAATRRERVRHLPMPPRQDSAAERIWLIGQSRPDFGIDSQRIALATLRCCLLARNRSKSADKKSAEEKKLARPRLPWYRRHLLPPYELLYVPMALPTVGPMDHPLAGYSSDPIRCRARRQQLQRRLPIPRLPRYPLLLFYSRP